MKSTVVIASYFGNAIDLGKFLKFVEFRHHQVVSHIQRRRIEVSRLLNRGSNYVIARPAFSHTELTL